MDLEGYDIEIRVFEIKIKEDLWNLYIFYARGSTSIDLVLLRAKSMGDTKSHQGIFKMIHVLNGGRRDVELRPTPQPVPGAQGFLPQRDQHHRIP